jgi:hypothetical protein
MRQRETSDPSRSLSLKGRKRKARRDLIRIVLIIAIFGTAIVLTCELDTSAPAFIIAIALFLFAARPGVPPARHPPPPPPPHHRHEYTQSPRRASINSTVPSTATSPPRRRTRAGSASGSLRRGAAEVRALVLQDSRRWPRGSRAIAAGCATRMAAGSPFRGRGIAFRSCSTPVRGRETPPDPVLSSPDSPHHTPRPLAGTAVL